MRDRLWFFGSHRDIGNANVVANSFYPDGSPGTVRSASVPVHRAPDVAADAAEQGLDVLRSANQERPARLRVGDRRGHRIQAAHRRARTTPRRSSGRRRSPTACMFEAAWGAMANGINFIYQPGIAKERGTPEWYATASRQDIVLNTRTVAAAAGAARLPVHLHGAVVGDLRHRIAFAEDRISMAVRSLLARLRRERRSRAALQLRARRIRSPSTTRRRIPATA